MDVTVTYEAQLRMAAGVNREHVALPAPGSLLDALHHVAATHGRQLTDRLLTADGQPQPGILMFVNEQPVPAEGAARQLLQPNDTVLLVPPISGG